MQAVGVTDFLGSRPAGDGLHVLVSFAALGGGEHVVAMPPDVLQDLIPVAIQSSGTPDTSTGRSVRSTLAADGFELGGVPGGTDLVLSIEPRSGGSISFRLDRQFAEQLRDLLSSALERPSLP